MKNGLTLENLQIPLGVILAVTYYNYEINSNIFLLVGFAIPLIVVSIIWYSTRQYKIYNDGRRGKSSLYRKTIHGLRFFWWVHFLLCILITTAIMQGWVHNQTGTSFCVPYCMSMVVGAVNSSNHKNNIVTFFTLKTQPMKKRFLVLLHFVFAGLLAVYKHELAELKPLYLNIVVGILLIIPTIYASCIKKKIWHELKWYTKAFFILLLFCNILLLFIVLIGLYTSYEEIYTPEINLASVIFLQRYYLICGFAWLVFLALRQINKSVKTEKEQEKKVI